jgi:cobalt/nickel transport system permease protein
MKHSFIDEYSHLNSFIHRLDPRTKLIASLVFILAVVITPAGAWQLFAAYFGVAVVMFALSKLPPLYVLKRSLVIFPFVLLIAVFIPFFKEGDVAGSYNIWLWQISVTYTGLLVLANVVVKAWLSILALILLSSTTKLDDLLNGLNQLGVPRVMILIVSFMYRYIFVVADEVMRIKQAHDSRNFGGSWLHHMKTIGNMLGTLFIRSYERAERVYAAMLSRGFEGQIRKTHQLKFRQADAYFGAVFSMILVLSYVILL